MCPNLSEQLRQSFVASIPMRHSRRDVKDRQPIHMGANGLNLMGNGGNNLQGLAGLAQQIGPLLQLALQQNSQHAGALQQQQQRVLPQYQLRGFSSGLSTQPAPLALTDTGAGDDPTDATAGATQHNYAADAGACASHDLSASNEELNLATATAALVASADAAAAAASKKRPAATAKASGKAKAVASKKKPAARGGVGGGGAHYPDFAARLRARPDGCPKCRGKPGCSPSCWREGTNPY